MTRPSETPCLVPYWLFSCLVRIDWYYFYLFIFTFINILLYNIYLSYTLYRSATSLRRTFFFYFPLLYCVHQGRYQTFLAVAVHLHWFVAFLG